MKKDSRSTWRRKATWIKATRSSANQKARARRHRKKLLAKVLWDKADLKRIIEELGLQKEAKEAGHEA